jgi:predicted transcriptional regulator
VKKLLKVKEIKIKPIKAALQEVVDTVNKAIAGEETGTLCDTIIDSPELLAKVITPKRYEMLKVIRKKKPTSIHELARMLKRNYKNVYTEVQFLHQLGLVEIVKKKNKKMPVVNYNEIGIRIPV